MEMSGVRYSFVARICIILCTTLFQELDKSKYLNLKDINILKVFIYQAEFVCHLLLLNIPS